MPPQQVFELVESRLPARDDGRAEALVELFRQREHEPRHRPPRAAREVRELEPDAAEPVAVDLEHAEGRRVVDAGVAAFDDERSVPLGADESSRRVQPALDEDRIHERIPDDRPRQVDRPLDPGRAAHGASVGGASDDAREARRGAGKAVPATLVAMTTAGDERARGPRVADLVLAAVLSVASTVVVIVVLLGYDTLAALDGVCADLPDTARGCDADLLGGTVLTGRLLAIGAWTLGIAAVVAHAIRRRITWPWPLVAIVICYGSLWGATVLLEEAYLP